MKKYKNQVEENEQSRIARNQINRTQNTPSSTNQSTLKQTLLKGGVVMAEIEPGSIAQELGLSPGDRLVQINEETARDAIQLRLADASENLSLTVVGSDGQARIFDIEKDAFEPVGIHVDSELFDGVKRCANKCPFCFVDQLPPRLKNINTATGLKNLRRTLYVRDDDYRLSFMHGHYITLTNLKEADYRRIIDEKLSPLCVSVHATDPQTRIRMVGNASAGNIMERLQFLIEGGISLNAQIVLCPEINDGAILDQSIQDLMTLWPGIESVAVVPVGLTKWMPDDRGMRTVRPPEAQAILAQLKPHQDAARRRFGSRFVYASDEMYLLAEQPMPRTSHYDSFPQYANGVGTIRAFLDETARLSRRAAFKPLGDDAPHIALVTGKLAAPALRELANVVEEKGLARASVVEIENTFWGGNVGCAGLIMGEEILAQLPRDANFDCIFLPPDAVDNQNRMLDDITLDELGAQLGAPVRCDAIGPLQLAEILKSMRVAVAA